MEEKLVTTREASSILNIPEQDVIDFATSGKLASIKLGGEYLRYRRTDILKLKNDLHKQAREVSGSTTQKFNLKEFLYFYDFYLVCAVVIVALMVFILKDIGV